MSSSNSPLHNHKNINDGTFIRPESKRKREQQEEEAKEEEVVLESQQELQYNVMVYNNEKIDRVLLELGENIVLYNDQEIENRNEIDRLCSETFQTIEIILPPLSASCIDKEEESKIIQPQSCSSITTIIQDTNHVRDEVFDIEQLRLYLHKITKWDDYFSGYIRTKTNTVNFDNSQEVNLLKSLDDSEITFILLINEKTSTCISFKEKPWKLSDLQYFLSKLEPKTFPLVDRTKDLLVELDHMFVISVGKNFDTFIPELVNTEPSLDTTALLDENSDKLQVLVITGDSGSGKTVYATMGMKHQLKDKVMHFFIIV